MFPEIILIACSSFAGVISAVFLNKIFRVKINSKKYTQSPSSRASIRSELVSFIFEKNLTTEAITHVYEAAQDGRIDRLERDKLLLKYKQQLDSLNEKIAYLQPLADFSDLRELRNSLVSFIEDRISVLDKKLLDLSKSSPLPSLAPSQDDIESKANRILTETSKLEPTNPMGPKMFKADDENIEQLHKEIAQALRRLEQVEIDKD
jgi:hypothetical protein